MNAELAKQRIASYMRGTISKEELDAFIDGFGDDLTEEAYSEFLIEHFEKYVAAEHTNEPNPEPMDASEAALKTEQKKGKSSHPGRIMYKYALLFCMKVAALCNFEFQWLRLTLSFPENLLTLKD